jgi:hypothetical protein
LEREFGSLRQEIHEGFESITNRFDDQAARLDRHAIELRERLARLERKSA